jgi:hypothetical protein
MNRPLRQRIVLSVLMAMGLIAAAAGIVKISLIGVVKDAPDIFYASADIGIWK